MMRNNPNQMDDLSSQGSYIKRKELSEKDAGE
jgi:hypothetical protein